MAPLEELITPLGWELIGRLPPMFRDDPDIRAIMHCTAKAAERKVDAVEYIRRQANPLTADPQGLAWWAGVLHIGLDTGATVEEQRLVIVNRYRAFEVDAAGSAWVVRVTARIGTSSWTYEENTPDPSTITFHLPYGAGSQPFLNAERVIREETPSEQALVFVSTGGFILDESQMDVEGMGI